MIFGLVPDSEFLASGLQLSRNMEIRGRKNNFWGRCAIKAMAGRNLFEKD
jgi:hypothetical protein